MGQKSLPLSLSLPPELFHLGGTKDAATGYIAPLSNEALAWNASYTYRYALIMGNLPDIRSIACALK